MTNSNTNVATPVATTVKGKRGKTPKFTDKSTQFAALAIVRDNAPGDVIAKFSEIGLSGHHLRQLGAGVGGGLFATGLGFIELQKDTSERPEGVKGKRPKLIVLTPKGKQFMGLMKANMARKAVAEARAAAAAEAAPQVQETVTEPVGEVAPESIAA